MGVAGRHGIGALVLGMCGTQQVAGGLWWNLVDGVREPSLRERW